jgi:uncharacterized protein GlcG (DUF336 family)
MVVSFALRALSVAVLTFATLAGPPSAHARLTAQDVEAIIRAAAQAIDATTALIAVTDREGIPLGVFRKTDGNSADADLAVSLARTAGFFSNSQSPLSSRTVRFISSKNFPPGVPGTPAGGLYGIEQSNEGCSLNAQFNPGKAITPSRSLSGGLSAGIITGKLNLLDSDQTAVNPGGVPIFKNGILVGGIGVAGVPGPLAEFAAFTGSTATPELGPRVPSPGVVVLDGINLPFVAQRTRPAGTGPGQFVGDFIVLPQGSARPDVPDGYLVGPLGSAELSPSDVDRIVSQAVAQANATRSAIRLPIGSRSRLTIAVTDLRGNILGLFRMPDALADAIAVVPGKARSSVYFSSSRRLPEELPGVPIGTAVTTRTLGFGAQPLFPPGIEGTGPGPFFPLLVKNAANPCTLGADRENRQNQSGVFFFPGSAPLYRDGQLIGGIGVSGDGVEVNDIVTEAGTKGFEAPTAIRADQIIINGVRLPYLKSPRAPTR